jgi:glutamine amidotransferase
VSAPQVVIVDYGIGNLHSVAKALRRAGAEPRISSDPSEVRRAERLVVPGVGAFADCMGCLVGAHLDQPVLEFIKTGRPFFGICVGMQMLFGESLEFGTHKGLGVIPGRVERLSEDGGFKVPHIGWNAIVPVHQAWEGTVLDGLPPGTMTYFVHSFAAVPDSEDARLADARYGHNRICAAVQTENVWGTQFHPEKSGEVGLSILSRFLAA